MITEHGEDTEKQGIRAIYAGAMNTARSAVPLLRALRSNVAGASREAFITTSAKSYPLYRGPTGAN